MQGGKLAVQQLVRDRCYLPKSLVTVSNPKHLQVIASSPASCQLLRHCCTSGQVRKDFMTYAAN